MSRHRVLVCGCGSVAAVKLPEIVAKVAAFAEVRLVLTDRAAHFFDLAQTYDSSSWASYRQVAHAVPTLRDADEWSSYAVVKRDPVVHIELRKWADVLLIAPLSANSLAKVATGLCDNLLACVARAWDFDRPAVVAPAMNTFMWEHPVTATQLDTLRAWGYTVVSPTAKMLACGDTGSGALATVDDIVHAVRYALERVPPRSIAAGAVASAGAVEDGAAGAAVAAGMADRAARELVVKEAEAREEDERPGHPTGPPGSRE